jgi:hypothetical protein
MPSDIIGADVKREGAWNVFSFAFLTAIFFYSGIAFSQSQYLTKSVSSSQFVWHVTNGVVQLCSGEICATPQHAAPVIPADAELIMLPNGGLWILTDDASYQSFCSILPNCVAPETPLTQTSKGVRYRYTTTNDNRLSAVHAVSGRISWCTDTPDCIP